MKIDLVDITVVLDRSGSMITCKDDMEGGFDGFIAEQRKVPGEARLTLVQFDTEYESVYKAVALDKVPKLVIGPRGGTALLDALGRTINETGTRLSALPEADRPGKVLFLIITDGQENSSKEFKRARIMEMIKHQTEQYQWTFVYLGANQDAIAESASMGIYTANTMSYDTSSGGIKRAYASMSRNTTSYRTSTPDSATANFFKQDEEEDATNKKA